MNSLDFQLFHAECHQIIIRAKNKLPLEKRNSSNLLGEVVKVISNENLPILTLSHWDPLSHCVKLYNMNTKMEALFAVGDRKTQLLFEEFRNVDCRQVSCSTTPRSASLVPIDPFHTKI